MSDASANSAPPPDGSGMPEDRRMYVIDRDWSARVNQGSASQYCHSRNEGEDFFHLILDGEVFLDNGNEKFCLNCALRHGLISAERLFWKRPRRSPESRL